MKEQWEVELFDFLPRWPSTKKIKNKRTHKPFDACQWGVNVRLVYKDKYGKLRSTFKTKEEINNNFYLHDNAL